MADLEPTQGPRDPAEASLSFGSFRLQPARQLLLDGDRPIAIGGRAFDILIALVDRAGELVTKEELVARAWPEISVDESNLRAQVAALRRALGDGRGGVRFVATVPGRGYRFVAPVSPSDRAKRLLDAGQLRRALPARLTQPIGRADVVRAIGNQLKRRRLVTIVGTGGIGKTTAALAVAEAMEPSYEDGVCFIDLTPLAGARHVPAALASVLGLSIVSDDPTPAAVAFLHERRMLLVFDGCEHFVGAVAAFAEQVLRGAPGARVLATSREPLRADGESVHRLTPLEVPPAQASIGAAEAQTFSAVELFVERASSCIDGFELSDADAPLVAEICRRLDGLPLAIELVARRIDAFGVRGVAEHLDDRFRLLSRGLATAPPRQQTLQATLDWSWECLPEDERAILRRLAVFAGSFTLEMASAIVGDAADAVDGVASLVARSLVAAEVSGTAAIYRLLDTTRAYALARLVESGEYDRIARRHAENLVAVMERASGE
jgi:predicted ATPase/DNA-binding winged helix-turn-helix (wHTH) protein